MILACGRHASAIKGIGGYNCCLSTEKLLTGVMSGACLMVRHQQQQPGCCHHHLSVVCDARHWLVCEPSPCDAFADSQKQYWDIKKTYRDVILFFKVGKVSPAELCSVRLGMQGLLLDGWSSNLPQQYGHLAVLSHPLSWTLSECAAQVKAADC